MPQQKDVVRVLSVVAEVEDVGAIDPAHSLDAEPEGAELRGQPLPHGIDILLLRRRRAEVDQASKGVLDRGVLRAQEGAYATGHRFSRGRGGRFGALRLRQPEVADGRDVEHAVDELVV